MRFLFCAAISLVAFTGPIVGAPNAGGKDPDENAFDSGLLDQQEGWNHTFLREGTYAYHCHPHPFMTGRVIVAASADHANASVRIVGNRFVPDEVTVRPGGVVEWTNEDAVPHSATSDEAAAGHHGGGVQVWMVLILVGVALAAGSLLFLRRIG